MYLYRFLEIVHVLVLQCVVSYMLCFVMTVLLYSQLMYIYLNGTPSWKGRYRASQQNTLMYIDICVRSKVYLAYLWLNTVCKPSVQFIK